MFQVVILATHGGHTPKMAIKIILPKVLSNDVAKQFTFKGNSQENAQLFRCSNLVSVLEGGYNVQNSVVLVDFPFQDAAAVYLNAVNGIYCFYYHGSNCKSEITDFISCPGPIDAYSN